jgi:HEAT repeat protein
VLLVLLPTFTSHLLERHEDDSIGRLHLLTHESKREEQIHNVKKSLLSKEEDEVVSALSSARENKLIELVPEILPLLTASNDRIREQTAITLRALNDTRAVPVLFNALIKEKDVFIKIEMARALLSLGHKEGLLVLHEISMDRHSDFARSDAQLHLLEWLKNAPSSAKELSMWLTQNYPKIIFDKSENKYYVP